MSKDAKVHGSEIIEVVERRRRWPVEVRLGILDEVMQPGGLGGGGCRSAWRCARVGLSVYQWLRQVREGRMRGLSLSKPEAAATFAPVSIVPEGGDSRQDKPVPTPPLHPPAQTSSGAASSSKRRSGAVEIRLVVSGARPPRSIRSAVWARCRPMSRHRFDHSVERSDGSKGVSARARSASSATSSSSSWH